MNLTNLHLSFVVDLPIQQDLLLARDHTVEHFKCVRLIVEDEFPSVRFFGTIEGISLGGRTYAAIVFPTSLTSNDSGRQLIFENN